MITIGVVDDNVGGMYLLGKLRQTLPCNYVFVLADKPFVGAGRVLFARAEALAKELFARGCDAVVFSSVALAFVGRALSLRGNAVYYCEAPVLHSATYTVSNVLVATCDPSATFPVDNTITVVMPRFVELAEAGNEQHIVDYIRDSADMYSGSFDCIALGHSSMNNYKRCFKRVFPNAQVFDSVDGVVRRLRKKYKKNCKEDGNCTIVDENFTDMTEKYAYFLE